MPLYPVLSPIRYKGDRRPIGAQVEMTTEEAAEIRPGVLGDPIGTDATAEATGPAGTDATTEVADPAETDAQRKQAEEQHYDLDETAPQISREERITTVIRAMAMEDPNRENKKWWTKGGRPDLATLRDKAEDSNITQADRDRIWIRVQGEDWADA